MMARLAFSAAALLVLAGCSAQQSLHALREAISDARTRVQADQRQFAAAVSDRAARMAAQDVGKPWLAGRSQPLARDVILPQALRGDVDTTLLFAGRLDLPSLAERLTSVTGMEIGRAHV